MAQSPIPRPDPPDRLVPNRAGEGPTLKRTSRSESEALQARWTSTLAACGGEALAADLALDLVLNDICEQARSATGASAAAIALAREDGEIVCRASTGEGAPDLGIPLNTQSGLSAVCVQTRKWQYCEDGELDERVDPQVCRRLGVRSILVYPVVKQQQLLGIIEGFSARPKAFGSGEIGALEKLAREVVDSLDRAAAVRATAPAAQYAEGASLETQAVPATEQRDFWNDVLSLLVIALAVILGWVVGRGGWRSGVRNILPRKAVTQANVGKTPSVPSGPETAEDASGKPASSTQNSGSENGITVYRNGKIVFHASPGGEGAKLAAPSDSSPRNHDVVAPSLRLAPEIANEYLVRRTEPEYPEAARAKRIQGAVEIDVIVGADGKVEKLTPVRGQALLLSAANDAIRQWQFQPFFHNGQPESFQTRVTLQFRLP
jgi:TonB family protein